VILLGMQEMDLGVHEVILAEELERGLCHPNGHDLLAELDETHARVHGIADDRAAEATRTDSRCPNRVGPGAY
jgi:hypothetical protein